VLGSPQESTHSVPDRRSPREPIFTSSERKNFYAIRDTTSHLYACVRVSPYCRAHPGYGTTVRSTPSSPRRVVVVDDSESFRELLVDFLADEEGFAVVGTADDGAAGVTLGQWRAR